MITPKQASETLKVPPSTLRRWAVRFDDFLSPQPGKKRSYTVEDLDVFRRIKQMSAEGFTLDQIANLLPVTESPDDQTTDLVTLPDFVQALQYAQDRVGDLQSQVDNQDDRLSRLEDWLTLPWYKRLTKRPDDD